MTLDNGILQAYLDHELTPEELKTVREHLAICPECRDRLTELQNNSRFVHDIFTGYQKAHQQMPVNTSQAWEHFTNSRIVLSSNRLKGWINMMKIYRKTAIAVSLVLGISLSLCFQPVRTAAAQLLAVFRVERIQTVNISPEQLNQLSELFQKNRGSINIQNFGELKVEGATKPQMIARNEILQRVPGSVLPEIIPGGYRLQETGLNTACNIKFNLNLGSVNSLLHSLGATQLLPAELDGKTFEIHIPEMVGAQFSNERNNLHLIETRSPELITPEGVSPESIRNALLQLPFLPPELISQLRAINDWQHTLIVPSSDGNTEKVIIRGYHGIYFSAAKNAAIMAKFFPEIQPKLEKNQVPETAGVVIWQVNDLIYILSGNVDKNTLISLAGSIIN